MPQQSNFDKEQWAAIEGFSDYAVSTHGRVVNLKLDRELEGDLHHGTYKRVNLFKDGRQHKRLVSHLMAEAFMTAYESGLRVMYRDGNPSNLRIDNLKLSEKHYRGSFRQSRTQPQKRYIRIVETGAFFTSIANCAEYMGVNPNSIYKVLNGERRSLQGKTFEIFTLDL